MKKKIVKKALSMLMLVVLLISLLPTSMMATENESTVRSADITPPTNVSLVSFTENGQTLSEGDDIHFIITAQDTESEISAEKSIIYINGGSSEYGSEIKKVEGLENTYELTFADVYLRAVNEINHIYISDTAGNITKLDLEDEDGNALYTFFGDVEDVEEVSVKITECSFDTTEVVLDDTNTSMIIEVVVKTDVSFLDSQDVYLEMEFTCDGHGIAFDLAYDEESNCFKGDLEIEKKELEGLYHFSGLYLYINDDIQMQEIEESVFVVPDITITKKFTDKQAPTYDVLYFTKNGQRVENGFSITKEDELRLYCSFNEEVIGSNTDESIELLAVTDLMGFNVITYDEGYHIMHLTWNDTLGMYETIIDISDFYPTEWRLDISDVYDNSGNKLAEDSRYELGKYYFFVVENGTCVIPEYECEVVLENGESVITDKVKVNRMIAFDDLFPNGKPAPIEKEGEKFIGWYYRVANKGEYLDTGWKSWNEDKVIDLRTEEGLHTWGFMSPTIYIKSVYEKLDVTPDTETTPDIDDSTNVDTVPDEKTVVELSSEVVQETVESISTSKAGAQIIIDMSREDGTVATVVPAEILEAARENKVNIVLDMGNYRWSIQSDNILDGELSDINLEVTMDTNAIPTSTIEALANGDKTRQLSLTHNGDFGFKASLTVEVGSEYEGKFGNLYYHDSTGKLVFMNAGKIQKDGTVTVDFSHASDYVLIFGEDRTMEETDTDIDVPPTDNVGNPSVESPKTSDESRFLWGLPLIMGCIVMAMYRKKVSK